MRIFSQTCLESSFTNESKSRVECHKQAEMCQLMSQFEFPRCEEVAGLCRGETVRARHNLQRRDDWSREILNAESDSLDQVWRY